MGQVVSFTKNLCEIVNRLSVFKTFCHIVYNGLKIKHELFYCVCYHFCNSWFGASTTSSKDASLYTISRCYPYSECPGICPCLSF
ncbi:hypothetical protein Hanom_Chr04g00280931 [Helianthus anomalus]